ncbi:Ppx/GppA phosphatase family protein [Parapedomonas caeni]
MPNDVAERSAAGPVESDQRGRTGPGTGGRNGVGPRGQAAERLYAALDLGTNNCRLLVAKPARGGFHVVDAFSRIVRLGEGLAATGLLSDAAQNRAISALKVCADKLRRRNVILMRHVATEACRRASNAGQFVSRVYEETGLALDVISTKEEARLAVLGCQTLLPADADYGLVFDIGGGSTELVLVRQEANGSIDIAAWTSMPWGVVSLAEAFDTDQASPGVYALMKERVGAYLSTFEMQARVSEKVNSGRLSVLGTSGTVTTLASLHLGLTTYDRRQVDGCWVPSGSMRTLASDLAAMSMDQRAELPCIGKERADLMMAGCAILETILDFWPIDQLRVADRGIREGILRVLMRRDGLRL